MDDTKVEARIRRKYRSLAVEMDERRRRQWAAAEARDIGRGGISMVARATGLSRLRLKRHEFHGDWNYTISPRR
jgi:hypothetical protein